MPNKQKELFVRTKSGAIWALDVVEGVYCKPNCSTVINRNDECVVAASNDIRDLVQAGDLLKIGNKFIGVGTKDVKENGHINDTLLFDALYVPTTEKLGIDRETPTGFSMEAFKIFGRWIIV